MRVLHCIPSMEASSGGPARALVEMCRATKLVAPDTQISIATTDHGMTPPWLESLRSSLPEDVDLRLFSQLGRHTLSISLPLFWWCWRAAPSYDILHIHAALHPISSGCALIARRKRKPYVVRPHGTLSPYTFSHRRSLLKRLYYTLVDSKTISGAAVLHFTTEQELVKASRLGLTTRTKVVPIPFAGTNGQGGPGRDVHTLLFVGRLHPVKGLETLLPALAKVKEELIGVKLVIAGSGPKGYERSLRQLATHLGVTDAVQFAGFVEGSHKDALLQRAAVFVLPSHQENFSLAAVEAMAAGLPVVVTKGCDLWPEVEKGAAGLVVEQDVEHLAGALVHLLRDDAARRTMGEKGVELVKHRFSHQVVGEALVTMYQEALEQSHARN